MLRIFELLFPPRATETLVRDASGASVCACYAPRQLRVGDYSATALLPYRTPLVRALVRETKFRGNLRAARLLAQVLRAHLASMTGSVVLVPIPLGRRRRRERGYNQVELVAQLALLGLIGPLALEPALLSRTRDTLPQTRLPRQGRERNVRGVFAARPCDPGAAYLILDDVLTTGATLGAAADALRDAGATRIGLLALAH